ncbi:hypothetical protein PoB_006605600 [Plakobranchus ocellatus]|uniref:Uncharacterized protein n=1 Tax=Plakobranchus ocellatus TaxID=259542 RepID=A0AAV4D5W9_9GAST|nr:hypothetical protein PoB_006605600 [Plakobranchus ocellatus]
MRLVIMIEALKEINEIKFQNLLDLCNNRGARESFGISANVILVIRFAQLTSAALTMPCKRKWSNFNEADPQNIMQRILNMKTYADWCFYQHSFSKGEGPAQDRLSSDYLNPVLASFKRLSEPQLMATCLCRKTQTNVSIPQFGIKVQRQTLYLNDLPSIRYTTQENPKHKQMYPSYNSE